MEKVLLMIKRIIFKANNRTYLIRLHFLIPYRWLSLGKFHRENSPAIIYADGTKRWYKNGKLHRTNGPAIIHSNGIKEFWENNMRIRAEYPVRKLK